MSASLKDDILKAVMDSRKQSRQKVELYSDFLTAKYDMDRLIRSGWKVHTCTASSYYAGYSIHEKVLVVYEK